MSPATLERQPNSITRRVINRAARIQQRTDLLQDEIEHEKHRLRTMLRADVERLARKILQKNLTTLKEFVLGDGIYHFVNKRGESVTDYNLGCLLNEKLHADLTELVDQWDAGWDITTQPMRFTAYGPTLTNR